MDVRSFVAGTVFFGVIVACGAGERSTRFGTDGLGPDGTDPNTGFGPGNTQPPAEGQCATAEAEAVKPPVDVILSVDQSGSMSDDIANVKNNINQLSTYLAATGLDYRVVMVGEVGTSTYQICVPQPLGGPGCASNGNVFRAVNQHIESWDSLTLLLSTLDQTSGPKAWADFLRPDAVKAFVPVTDDNSVNINATNFDTQLLAKAGGTFGSAASRRYVMYPIVGAPNHPSQSPKCGSNAVNTGTVYLELANLTKGKWFPICLTNFGPVFQEIATNIAQTVACDLPVPKPTDGTQIDFTKVNVTVSPTSGGDKPVLQDSSKPCASGADGWQYSADKTRLYLCGATCDAVRQDPGAKVKVTFGCQTKVK